MKISKRELLISAALYFLFPTTGYTAQASKVATRCYPHFIFCLVLIAGLSGCASLTNSMLLGGGVGAAAGTGVGLAAFGNTKGTVLSAASGAAVGALFGLLLHKDPAPSNDVGRKEGQVPSLTRPNVSRLWVDPTIDGNKYIDGHWIYLIDRPSVWSK